MFVLLSYTLENDSLKLIQRFADNIMKAYPDKFQAVSIGDKTRKHNLSFNLDNVQINCEENVVLLGVDIDFRLKIDKHVSGICKKAK